MLGKALSSFVIGLLVLLYIAFYLSILSLAVMTVVWVLRLMEVL